MNRIVSSLIVVTSLVAGLAWACATLPSGAGSLQGPALLHQGTTGAFKLLAPGEHGQYGDRTRDAVWTVTPAASGRVEGPGAITALVPGPMTVSATLNGSDSTLPVTVIAAGEFQLSGTVDDEAGEPIAGAIITARNQANGYFEQQTTDAAGAYSLKHAFGSVTVTAQFLTATVTRTVNVTADTPSVDFVLRIPAGMVDISGQWTTTFAAAPSCASALPPIVQQRTYFVAIRLADVFDFTFSSPAMPFGSSGSFATTFTSNVLTLPIPDSDYYGALAGGLLEKVGDGQWLDVSGVVTVSQVTATSMTGVLTGQFDYYEVDPLLPNGPLITSIPKVHCAGTGTATFMKTGDAPAGRRRR